MMSFTMLLLLSLVAPQSTNPHTQSSHAQMNHRGGQVMGFDQDKTTHHFLLFEDGGAIDVSVKDAADTTNRAAIRAHLPHIAELFAQGNFEAPLVVHAVIVPGTVTMASLKKTIVWKYVETDKGGRVDISTTNAEALAAIHQFLTFQITDHKTGDPLTVTKRR